MYEHFEARFPGREKQLEQLANITMGVSLSFSLLCLSTQRLQTNFSLDRLIQKITHLKVYLCMAHLPQAKQP